MVEKFTMNKIIEQYLNDYSKMYYLRELASLLNRPHQTVKPYVDNLVKEGILIKIQRKNITDYGLNFGNGKIYDFLVIAEKEKLISKLKEDIILETLFEKLSPYFANNIFIVFGSSAKKMRKGSDIDLLIVGKSNINNLITNFEDVYNKKIHKIQIVDLDELNKTLISEIFKKHIIFNDTERIVRFFGGLYEKNRLV
jgi:predicted nucleotidyltransferase